MQEKLLNISPPQIDIPDENHSSGIIFHGKSGIMLQRKYAAPEDRTPGMVCPTIEGGAALMQNLDRQVLLVEGAVSIPPCLWAIATRLPPKSSSLCSQP